MDGRKRPRQARRIRHDCFVQSSESSSDGSYEEEDEQSIKKPPTNGHVHSKTSNETEAPVEMMEGSQVTSKEATLAHKVLYNLSRGGTGATEMAERKHRKRKKDVLYARQRREREKGDEKRLQDDCVALARTNLDLRDESARLQEIMTKAKVALSDAGVSESGEDARGERSQDTVATTSRKRSPSTQSKQKDSKDGSKRNRSKRSARAASRKPPSNPVETIEKPDGPSTDSQPGISSSLILTIDQQLRLLNQAPSNTKDGPIKTEELPQLAPREPNLPGPTTVSLPPTTLPGHTQGPLLTDEAALRAAIADLQRQLRQTATAVPNQPVLVQPTTRRDGGPLLMLPQVNPAPANPQSNQRLEQSILDDAVQSMFQLHHQRPPLVGPPSGTTSQGQQRTQPDPQHTTANDTSTARETTQIQKRAVHGTRETLESSARPSSERSLIGRNGIDEKEPRDQTEPFRPGVAQPQPLLDNEEALRAAIADIQRQLNHGTAPVPAPAPLPQPTQAKDVQAMIAGLLQQHKEASARYAEATVAAERAAAEQNKILERLASLQAQEMLQALQVPPLQPNASLTVPESHQASFQNVDSAPMSAPNRPTALPTSNNHVQATSQPGSQLGGLSPNELAVLSQLLTASSPQGRSGVYANGVNAPFLSATTNVTTGRHDGLLSPNAFSNFAQASSRPDLVDQILRQQSTSTRATNDIGSVLLALTQSAPAGSMVQPSAHDTLQLLQLLASTSGPSAQASVLASAMGRIAPSQDARAPGRYPT